MEHSHRNTQIRIKPHPIPQIHKKNDGVTTTNKQTIPYMKDARNNKLDHPHEKEPLFHNHWQNLFNGEETHQ
jgi:hypothetical protein